jgi:hypothetical protein
MNEGFDLRWNRLRNRTWKYASCGETHNGLFELGCAKPDFWQAAEVYLPNSAVKNSANCLTEDFCVLDGEHYFIRCVLKLPLVGAPGEHLGFGVWSTLSRKNFERYQETFDGGESYVGRLRAIDAPCVGCSDVSTIRVH